MSLQPAPAGIVTLPREAEMLLARLGAPARLVAHLTLVHSSATKLVDRFSEAWPCLELDRASVLLGAAVHDVGKITHPQELTRSGKAHEAAGEALLRREGFAPGIARLARTHGRHNAEGDLAIEDLLVILADAVWKGARRPTVEERIRREIVRACHEETWHVDARLDEIVSDLTASADERLAWHAAHGVQVSGRIEARSQAMGWASHAIARLQAGETVVLRPRGHSMAGKVDDGDVVTVAPYNAADPRVGDIVLVKVKGREYLHLVKARQEDRYLIGNIRGRINGWVGRSAIFGCAIRVESPRAYAERLQQARPKP